MNKPRIRVTVNQFGGITFKPKGGYATGLIVMSFSLKKADFDIFEFIEANKRFANSYKNTLKAITI